MANSTQTVGNLSMLMYALITALSTILIHQTTQQISPLLSAFYTFSFCLLIYNIAAKGTLAKFETIKENVFIIFILNITTAVCWIFTFVALKFLPPELFLYIYLGAMPIAASCLERKFLIKSGLSAGGLFLLTLTYRETHLILGFILAFLGGICGMLYSFYSKKISNQFSTAEILSLRFYLLVLITFILCYQAHNLYSMQPHFYIIFALLSFISVIIPLTLFQMGIKSLALSRALAYLPLTPFLCYVFNLLMGNQPFNSIQLSLALFLSSLMLIKEK